MEYSACSILALLKFPTYLKILQVTTNESVVSFSWVFW